MKVWVIEQGEYDMRCVMGVAASPEAAERFIKSVYGQPPQIVVWEELRRNTHYDCFELVGHFEAVPGHCAVANTDSFSIEEYEVAE